MFKIQTLTQAFSGHPLFPRFQPALPPPPAEIVLAADSRRHTQTVIWQASPNDSPHALRATMAAQNYGHTPRTS